MLTTEDRIFIRRFVKKTKLKVQWKFQIMSGLWLLAVDVSFLLDFDYTLSKLHDRLKEQSRDFSWRIVIIISILVGANVENDRYDHYESTVNRH